MTLTATIPPSSPALRHVRLVSRDGARHEQLGAPTRRTIFLASRALPWWAIGTSLIAANISAEQIVRHVSIVRLRHRPRHHLLPVNGRSPHHLRVFPPSPRRHLTVPDSSSHSSAVRVMAAAAHSAYVSSTSPSSSSARGGRRAKIKLDGGDELRARTLYYRRTENRRAHRHRPGLTAGAGGTHHQRHRAREDR